MGDSLTSTKKDQNVEDPPVVITPDEGERSDDGSRASTALATDIDDYLHSPSPSAQEKAGPSSPISTNQIQLDGSKSKAEKPVTRNQDDDDGDVFFPENFEDSHFYDVDLDKLTTANNTVAVDNTNAARAQNHVEVSLTDQPNQEQEKPGPDEPDDSFFKQVKYTFKSLVELMTTFEKVLFFIGVLSALLLGLVAPYVIYSFGKLVAAFVVHAQLVSRIPLVFLNGTAVGQNLTVTVPSITTSIPDIVFNTSDITVNESLYPVTTSSSTGQLPATPTITNIHTIPIPIATTTILPILTTNQHTNEPTGEFVTASLTEPSIWTTESTARTTANIIDPPSSPTAKAVIVRGKLTPDLVAYFNDTLKRRRRELDEITTTETSLTTPDEPEPQKSPAEMKKVEDLLYEKATNFALRMAILGLTSFVVGFLMVVCLSVATESFMFRFRQNLLKTILHRDLTWFEQEDKEQLQTLMTVGMNKFHNVLGENFGQLLCYLTTVLACSIEAFIYGWKLAFVLFSLLPCYSVAAWFYAKLEYACTISQQEEFGKAEVTATQTLKEMKTVMAFGGEQKESQRFNTVVRGVRMAGQKKGWKCGLILAGVCLFTHLTFAVGFWFGMYLVLEGMESGEMNYGTKQLYIVLFSALVAAITSGQLTPYIDGLRQTAPWVKLSLRLLRTVLSGFNLDVEAGESVAIVGMARGGKSTALQLLQRFYDPSSGTITVDDHDLRTLNVGWLRQQVGLVEASPVIFSTTIRENIRYGRQDASPEDIVLAACTANAHEFIMKLPQQYDTIVGEHGTVLTESKKQRVAIARALVRDPRILLLDGATTQIDIQEDKVVQAALEKARSSRTTIIVPHKLSSIMHIKQIVVISEGKIIESGSHAELMEKDGIYCQLFMEEAMHEKPDVPDWDDEEDYIDANVAQESPTEVFSNRLLPMHRIRIHKNSDWLDASKFKIRPTLLRLFRMSRPFSTFCFLGLLSAASYGLLFVIFTVILGHFIGVLAERPEDYADKAAKYAWDALLLGVFSALFTFLQNSMFAYYGERLSNRLRKHLFQAMLGQEMSWFDDPGNTTRALCFRLAADPTHIQEGATSSVGQLVQIATTTAACALITLFYSWKIAIVAATFTSIAVFITCLQTKVNTADSALQSSALEVAGKIASESLRNIKTLASLHAENVICGQHKTALLRLHSLSVDIYSIRGLLFGITRCTPLLLYSAVNSLGGFLIMFEGYSQQRVIVLQQVTETAFFAIVQAVPLIYVSIRALEAAHRMFQLLDRKPAIDSSISAGFMLPIRGNRSINFESLEFDYVSKRFGPAVEKLTFDIVEGKTTAIVGPSGSGKSTCIYLIQRLYDPKEGSVVLDNIDLQNLNVPWLRSQLAIVTKDSLLYHRTIIENVAYGDNMRHVRVDEVLQACRKVYADTFISSLPKELALSGSTHLLGYIQLTDCYGKMAGLTSLDASGYDTVIGDEELTNLQKFQIAAARALVRKPRVVLIDDLFFPSTFEDQEVLRKIIAQLQEGRTCLITSHCLKAVRDYADHFVVLNTKVLERGSHQELMDLHGHYFRQWHRENVKLRRASAVRLSRRHSLQASALNVQHLEFTPKTVSRQLSVA